MRNMVEAATVDGLTELEAAVMRAICAGEADSGCETGGDRIQQVRQALQAGCRDDIASLCGSSQVRLVAELSRLLLSTVPGPQNDLQSQLECLGQNAESVSTTCKIALMAALR